MNKKFLQLKSIFYKQLLKELFKQIDLNQEKLVLKSITRILYLSLHFLFPYNKVHLVKK